MNQNNYKNNKFLNFISDGDTDLSTLIDINKNLSIFISIYHSTYPEIFYIFQYSQPFFHLQNFSINIRNLLKLKLKLKRLIRYMLYKI